MPTRPLDLTRYDTDKINHDYLRLYDTQLAPYRERPVQLLELGVLNGGSLQLWRDYFPPGSSITGIDLQLPAQFHPGDGIHAFEGDQSDRSFLSRVAEQVAPEGFDIIIDDASHMGEETRIAFWHLFDRHLKPGGLYAIEDWGTGYWDDWPDGRRLDPAQYDVPLRARLPLWRRVLDRVQRKATRNIPFPCHSYGVPGFVKQLIDEQAAADVSRGAKAGTTQRYSRFHSIVVMPSIVFVRKR